MPSASQLCCSARQPVPDQGRAEDPGHRLAFLVPPGRTRSVGLGDHASMERSRGKKRAAEEHHRSGEGQCDGPDPGAVESQSNPDNGRKDREEQGVRTGGDRTGEGCAAAERLIQRRRPWRPLVAHVFVVGRDVGAIDRRASDPRPLCEDERRDPRGEPT